MNNRRCSTILKLLIVLFFVVENDAQNCSIPMRSGFSDKPPIVLHSDVTMQEFFYPSVTGEGNLTLNTGEVFRLACPGTTFANTKIRYTLARCVANNQFRLESIGIVEEFQNIACSKKVVSVARANANIICTHGLPYEVGFSFSNGRTEEFIRVYDLCHDDAMANTIYAHAKIRAVMDMAQRGNRTSSFKKGIFFNNIGNPQRFYEVPNQISVVADLLQRPPEDHVSKNNTRYLARGHLVANSDLVYLSQQQSTYYFANVLPMWQSINNGNWKMMEAAVRSYASRNRIDLDIYVGGYGILQLDDKNGVKRQMYLKLPSRIPVPKILFKVVHHKKTKSGVVFITVNNPYLERLSTDYSICTDVCNRTFHVGWDRANFTKGFSYCCTISDFRAIYPSLPSLTTLNLLV